MNCGSEGIGRKEQEIKKMHSEEMIICKNTEEKNETKLLKEENNFKFITASKVFNLFILLAKNMSYKDM